MTEAQLDYIKQYKQYPPREAQLDYIKRHSQYLGALVEWQRQGQAAAPPQPPRSAE